MEQKIITGKIDYHKSYTATGILEYSVCSGDEERIGEEVDEMEWGVCIGDEGLPNLFREFNGKKIQVSYFISDTDMKDLTEEQLAAISIHQQIGGDFLFDYGIGISGYSSWTVTSSGYVDGNTVIVGGHNLSKELATHNKKYIYMTIHIS